MSGSGTGHIITSTPGSPSAGHPDWGVIYPGYDPGLLLARYQELMRLPIAAFNGLNKPDEVPQFECSTIWRRSDRDYLTTHLVQAENMRRDELGFYVRPTYIEEEHKYIGSLVLRYKHLIAIGERTVTDVSLGYTLNLGAYPALNDPVELSIATTVTDVSELHVYYPDEDYEIKPSYVAISGGVATIKIPRSRLVRPELQDDREDPLDYYDNDNILETVDVKRVYYSVATGLTYVWDSIRTAGTAAAETTQNGRPSIVDHRTAIVDHSPAAYSGGVWTYADWASTIKCQPDSIRAKYISGLATTLAIEIDNFRLAHTLMPNKPSSCPTVHMYWERDTAKTDNLTPYGDSVGAVAVWMHDSRMKVGMGGKFPSMRV